MSVLPQIRVRTSHLLHLLQTLDSRPHARFLYKFEICFWQKKNYQAGVWTLNLWVSRLLLTPKTKVRCLDARQEFAKCVSLVVVVCLVISYLTFSTLVFRLVSYTILILLNLKMISSNLFQATSQSSRLIQIKFDPLKQIT